jgi:FixJ family two-component response regulator
MSARKPIVHVVDDDASFRKAISRLIRAAGYELRCYPSAVEFLAATPGESPGCVLLDLHMPGTSGLDLQNALAKSDSSLPIVFLTGHGDIPTSVHAMRGGAEDFLTKPVKKDLLFAAIEHALARDARERPARVQQREWRACYDTLTPREREVMVLVVAGKLNKQIADDLGTVERTVKAHRAQVMEKMQVTSLAELVRVAGHLPGGKESPAPVSGPAPQRHSPSC